MTPPREGLTDYEAKARELYAEPAFVFAPVAYIAAALRAAEASALERVLKAKGRCYDDCIYAMEARELLRSLAPSHESPPAKDQDEVAMFGAFGHGEPAAPAPLKMDEDGCCVVCGRGLEPCYACESLAPSAAEKRIAELEVLLRECEEALKEALASIDEAFATAPTARIRSCLARLAALAPRDSGKGTK